MRVHLLGVRGSTPAPGAAFVGIGGHTSCIAIAVAEHPGLVLDAGTGLRGLDQLMAGRPFVGTVALTHLHWDHVMGLPFAQALGQDESEVEVLLPSGGKDPGGLLAQMIGPPFFPADVRELGARPSFSDLRPGPRRIDKLTLEARWLPHGRGRALGFRVSGSGVLAYLPDHGPADLTQPSPEAVALCREADLVLHDAQFGPGEEAAARAAGHATAEYAAAVAREAGARRLLLFHHHPDREDRDVEALARALDESSLPVEPAREGAVIELG